MAANGQYYTLRIVPYRTTENSIKGLVITIIDSLETDRAKKTIATGACQGRSHARGGGHLSFCKTCGKK